MTNGSDPITPLTSSEKALVAELEKLDRKQLLQELKANLQTAIEIELATIPIYLYTYYSINRTYTTGEQLDETGKFANKAAGQIMSVAVEEMLHMSLSSNILYSLGQQPQLYRKSPSPYPTPLPYHNPVGPPGPDGDDKVLIPLAKFGYEQLWHFLQIEYPEPIDAMPEDRNWDTIGQFYSYIRCLISTSKITDADFQTNSNETQIQGFNYSPNNVDTLHPDRPFDPWGIPPVQGEPDQQCTPSGCPSAAAAAKYGNQPDSHAGPAELITINSKISALEAIDTICDQGEGFAHEATDDPSGKEYSHYYKFLRLQAQLPEYEQHTEVLPELPVPPDPIRPTVTDAELAQVIFNFPDNPKTRPVGYVGSSYIYPPEYRALSDLCNGVYQYMLILTETVYRVPAGNQKLFFNEGMHRSMIWVLDKLVQAMRGFQFEDGHVLAPTFENYNLGARKDAYRHLLNLTETVTNCEQLSAMGYLINTIKTLPDASPYWADEN